MKKIIYICCFAIFVFTSMVNLFSWLVFLLAKQPLPVPPLFDIVTSVGSLVPPMVAAVVPKSVHLGLTALAVLVVIRRLWLAVVTKRLVPESFRGFTLAVSSVGAGFYFLGIAALVISMLLRAGSGAPVSFLFLPAALCIPWGYFLTEVFSFRERSAVVA